MDQATQEISIVTYQPVIIEESKFNLKIENSREIKQEKIVSAKIKLLNLDADW